MLNKSELVQKLASVGLSQYESKAYLALLELGVGNGYSIAKQSVIPTAKIYQVLAALAEKSFIISDNMEKPTYQAVDPDLILKKLNNEFNKQIKDLLPSLNGIEAKTELLQARRISNEGEIQTTIESFIASTKSKLLLTGWPEDIIPYEKLLKKVSKKARVYLLAYENIEFDFCEIFVHRRSDLVKKEIPERLFLAANDCPQAIAAFMTKNNSECIASSSHGVTRIIADHILHDISLNHLMNHLPEQIKKQSEKKLTELRMKLTI